MMNWFLKSNRWKHFLGGMAIGLLADTPYCAALAGIGIAGALEFKDKQHGGKWDWIDFLCTIAGVATSYAIKYTLISILK
jgi:hypothetical protein